MPRLLLIATLLCCASISRGATIATQGRASAPPDRALILLFMRTEAKPDGSGPQQLASTWGQTRQWLNNFGIKDEQIDARPSAARLFQDQKKYLIQKVIITQKLTPGKFEQDLETLAQLIDQASARGLLPASQLAMLAAEQEQLPPSDIPDIQHHFLFFLPANPQQLIDRAIQDGMKHLREDASALASAAHLQPPHLRDLRVDRAPFQPTDPAAGQVGPVALTLNNVHLDLPMTADFDVRPPAAAGAAGPQTLTITGTGRAEMPIERGVIIVRLNAPDASLQKALDRLSDATRQVQTAAASEGGKLELGGMSFYSGNPSSLGISEGGEGVVPAGAYRDMRVTVERKSGEAEGDFRKRMENLSQAIRPNSPPDMPLGDNPFMQILWGPRESSAYLARSLAAAIADASANAARIVTAVGGKPGALLDVDITPPETPIAGNPYLEMLTRGFSPLSDAATPVRLGEAPALTLIITARFAVEVP